MGRRRKNINTNRVVGISILILSVLIFAKTTLLKGFNPLKDINFHFKNPFTEGPIAISERSVTEDFYIEGVELKPEHVYVDVYFTRITDSKDVYVAISRKKPTTCPSSNLEYAIRQLIKGPTKYEQSHGIYTEIPPETKVIGIKEYPNRFNINLTSDFESGGGGDSLYTRVYQLIKTISHNTRKPVYLYLDGKKVSVLGGEGLMIKQPLRSDSLDE